MWDKEHGQAGIQGSPEQGWGEFRHLVQRLVEGGLLILGIQIDLSIFLLGYHIVILICISGGVLSIYGFTNIMRKLS